MKLRPPFPLLALLALYWSRQVCNLAFPAGAPEYFGATAVGNTVLPVVAATGAEVVGFIPSLVSGLGEVLPAAVASVPHSALRKSVNFTPLAVPASNAALYLAAHSRSVSALAWLVG